MRLIAGLLVLLDLWLLLAAAARRLPPGTARDVAGFLPDCVTMLRRLWGDPRVPRRARVALGLAAAWAISPVDLIPEFLPVIGPLDDVVVVALALRYALRQVPPAVVAEAWPGSPRVLDRLVGRVPRARDDGAREPPATVAPDGD